MLYRISNFISNIPDIVITNANNINEVNTINLSNTITLSNTNISVNNAGNNVILANIIFGSVSTANTILINNRQNLLNIDDINQLFSTTSIDFIDEHGKIWYSHDDLSEELDITSNNDIIYYYVYNPLTVGHSTANTLDEAITLQNQFKQDYINWMIPNYSTANLIFEFFDAPINRNANNQNLSSNTSNTSIN